MGLYQLASEGMNWEGLFAGGLALVFVAAVIYALVVPQGNKRWWFFTALTGILVGASFAVQGLAKTLLVDAAAFAAVGLVWSRDTAEAKKAARTYLFMMVAAVACLIAGTVLGGEGAEAPAAAGMAKLVATLLIFGFALKLALVPLYFWLPGVVEHSSPMTSVIIISVVDMAAFGELLSLRETSGWIFSEYQGIWLTLALLSMFGGALLAIAQKNIKRMLAFSTVDDLGYLVLGAMIGSAYGWKGALFGAMSHAFFKFLLFAAVGTAESRLGHNLTLADRGLASRFPISSATFIVGALGMIGVPPTFGFIGRWRLYLAGTEFGGLWLIVAMAAATGLALLYYVRAIHRVWFGPADEATQGGEPTAVVVLLVVLIIVSIVLGVVPGVLTGLLP